MQKLNEKSYGVIGENLYENYLKVRKYEYKKILDVETQMHAGDFLVNNLHYIDVKTGNFLHTESSDILVEGWVERESGKYKGWAEHLTDTSRIAYICLRPTEGVYRITSIPYYHITNYYNKCKSIDKPYNKYYCKNDNSTVHYYRMPLRDIWGECKVINLLDHFDCSAFVKNI